MNHQPFESWLLDDQLLPAEQKRELDSHLRTCPHCAAVAETGLVLRSTRMVSPAAGFTARFQERLAAQRLAERRKRFWGVIVFTLTGVSVLAWMAAPLIAPVLDSPAGWITLSLSYILFIITSFQALTQVGSVLLRVVPGFVPPFVWMVLASALAGISLLWTVSIWRFTRVPQGVK
jgi:hypothetical protein